MIVYSKQHARLENISDDGRWLTDETFTVGKKVVQRKAGQSARGCLSGWLSLRKECPELFAGMRVWCQPCAVVDSIIWRWQCDLEASETTQAVRVTNCLGAVWSEQSKEAAFLLATDGYPSG